MPITSHRPERGSQWVLDEDTSGGPALMIVAAGMDWLTAGNANSARVSYYVTPSPAIPDYYIQGTLDNEADGSPDDFAWFMLRRTSPGNFYAAGWYASSIANDCYIFRVIAGAYTQLANADCNFTGQNGAGSSVIRFSVAGDNLTLSKDGNVVLTASGGGAISTAGAAGVGAGNIRNATDDVSGALAIDDLSVVELR